MATVIDTSTASTSTAFSSQRKVDRCQNGVLWSVYWHGGAYLAVYFSTDDGATWTGDTFVGFAGTGSTYTPNASFFIDLDDYAHLVYKDRHDGYIYYRRGTPNAARTAWTWSAAHTVFGGDFLDYPDLIVHQEGTGWMVHVVMSRHDGTSFDSAQYRRFSVSSGGAFGSVTAGGLTSGSIGTYGYGNTNPKWPSIDFNHTGDGKTIAGSTPHLYVAWSAGATGAGKGIRFRKATYSAGSWTWGTEREIDSTRYVINAAFWLNCLFDGTRVAMAGQLFDGGANDLVLYERDAADTATTTRVLVDNLAAAESMGRGSATYDGGGNVYLFGRNSGGTGPYDLAYRKWERSTATLGARVSIDPDVGDNVYASAKRGYSNNLVEFIYTDGTASPYSVTYDAITLNTAPNAPTGLSPDGTTIDRTVTQRFSWTFSDPDGGDSQSGYDLRYRVSGGTTWTVVSGTTTNTFHDFAGGTFAAGDWEWQVRTYDAAGEVGPYSSSAFFTAASPPSAPSITDPTAGATIAAESYTVQWSTASQSAYQVRTVADSAGSPDTSTVYQDTGEITSSSARSRTVSFAVNNRAEHVQVRIKSSGLWSTWASVNVTVSYTPPAASTLTATADSPTGAIGVSVSPGDWPVTVSSVTFTGSGTGGMTGPTATDGVTDTHDWEAVCVATAVDGGTFDVKVDGTVVGQATVGTQFTHEGLSFTINDGATDYVAGDKFVWSTDAVKTSSHDLFRRRAAAAGDGIRIAAGVAATVTHTDWAVASGVSYEYRSRAYGSNGTSTYSAWVV